MQNLTLSAKVKIDCYSGEFDIDNTDKLTLHETDFYCVGICSWNLPWIFGNRVLPECS